VSDQRKPASVAAIGNRALEAFLVAVLAVMAVLVFGNVVLRYGFASGITISEELSRLLFVWLTFLGAIPVMYQGGHLGVDMLVNALPPSGRRACRIVSNLLMLACCVVFGWGAWEQTRLNMANYAPVSGLPTALSYAAAVVCAVGLGILVFVDLVRALRGADAPAHDPDSAPHL
jgi:TRAP-type transport system small permease protein